MRVLTGAEITELLTNATALGVDNMSGTAQYFVADGQTPFKANVASAGADRGRWRVTPDG